MQCVLLRYLKSLYWLPLLIFALLDGYSALSLAEGSTKAPSVVLHEFQFGQDPVHQAGLKRSVGNKFVVVLGDGFDEELSLPVLQEGLTELGLLEGKHYEILKKAATPKESGVVYISERVVNVGSQPLVFSHDATDKAVLAIKSLLKEGVITVER